VQNPTLTLKTVKGMGITFELNPRWERTLPSFGNFAWDIHRVPPNLRCRIPPRHLDLIKTRVILFGLDSAPQVHSRVSNINFDILIFRGHPINIP
jgi:hypothetical protein